MLKAFFSIFFLAVLTPILLQAEEKKSHEEVVKEAVEKVDKTGVKVGMKREEVMKLLGETFKEEKIPTLQADEKVLTWEKDKADIVTVTFVGDKVKAVAHRLIKPEEEDD